MGPSHPQGPVGLVVALQALHKVQLLTNSLASLWMLLEYASPSPPFRTQEACLALRGRSPRTVCRRGREGQATGFGAREKATVTGQREGCSLQPLSEASISAQNVLVGVSCT